MLQTLYAGAAYSKKNSRIFYDEKSVEAVNAPDYDFSSADFCRAEYYQQAGGAV